MFVARSEFSAIRPGLGSGFHLFIQAEVTWHGEDRQVEYRFCSDKGLDLRGYQKFCLAEITFSWEFVGFLSLVWKDDCEEVSPAPE